MLTDREKLIDLIINAKRSDPETGSFTEYLADFLLGYGVKLSDCRPVSQEQVEKVWRGEWVHTHSSDNFWTEVWKCSHCDFEDNYGECFDFCPFCGAAQTDEAVEMVMERLEALYEKID